eukprot:g3688.t1
MKETDLIVVISSGVLGGFVLGVLLLMICQMTFEKWGKFATYLMKLPTLPGSLVYESLVWLPLGATAFFVALESDYDEKESHCEDVNAWLHVMSFYLLVLGTIGLVSGLIKQLSPRDTLITVPRAVYVFKAVGWLFEIAWVIAGWTAYPVFEYRDDCNTVGVWSEILVVIFTAYPAIQAGLILLLCFIATPFLAKSQAPKGSYGSGSSV